jgi:hypothetical protein
MTIAPDLVIGYGDAIGDVKYKLTRQTWLRADLYEVTAFATAAGAPRAAIVSFRAADDPQPPTVGIGGTEVRHFAWLADAGVTPCFSGRIAGRDRSVAPRRIGRRVRPPTPTAPQGLGRVSTQFAPAKNSELAGATRNRLAALLAGGHRFDPGTLHRSDTQDDIAVRVPSHHVSVGYPARRDGGERGGADPWSARSAAQPGGGYPGRGARRTPAGCRGRGGVDLAAAPRAGDGGGRGADPGG